MSFLSRLLPTEGLYCVCLLTEKGMRNYWLDSIEQAEDLALNLDKAGNTVFIAQSTFSERGTSFAGRKGDLAYAAKAFFLDIDCGPGKPYADQRDGAAALSEFCKSNGFPMPSVVNSGNGLYAHWILANPIRSDQWQTTAKLLKQLVVATAPGLDADGIVADRARILRPIGTHNRKDPNSPKPVKLIYESPAIEFLEFVRILSAAAKKQKLDTAAARPPKAQDDLNAEFQVYDETPTDAQQVADRCLQIRQFRETRGNLSEPLWYASLGVVLFCTDGEALCHQWSSGHPDYDADDADKKIEHRRSSAGPTTCHYFGEINPQGCIGCKFSSKIKSPIVLGRPDPKPIEVVAEEEVPPAGYRRSEEGLFFEEDGRWVLFYDQDLYPVRLAFDESLGYEVMTIRHKLPHEGWLEFTMRSALIHDHKTLMQTMTDNHVKVIGVKEKQRMAFYIESYAQKLQRQRRMTNLMCQMGWKERNGRSMFVLGQKIFVPNEAPEAAALAKNVPNAATGFRTEGSLEAWVEQTKLFNQKGMEPFAFALLAGGFGAPLMKFTGFDGAMVSMVGDSGTGKTLMLRMIQSVWGYHNDLMMLRDDTKNALVSRLGVYGNLPLTVDEITNIDGMDLSDLVYRVTQGRDKARLTKTAEERKVLNTWNTLAVVTTNSSLAEKLAGAKQDAGAELNRIFEFYCPPHPGFCNDITTGLYWTLDGNYGLAGEKYAQWLVDNMDHIKPGLDKVRAMIDQKSEARAEERYWSAIAATAIYGGLVAQSLGLIKFQVAPLVEWVVDCIRGMRGEKTELTSDSVSILGQFLDEFAAHRLIVKHAAERMVTVIDPPRGSLVYRVEQDTNRVYVARQTFKVWLTKRHGAYNKVKNDLIALKVLRNANVRKVLGSGTMYAGSQQPCWEIDIKNPALGDVGLYLVQDAEMLARAPKEAK